MSEYWKKASFIKRMSQLAKQERLAREKKEAEKKKSVKEETLDEISQKLAGDYYGAATKKHIDKVGIKSNMYGRIEKDMGKQRKAGVDRAMDRVTGIRKTNEEIDSIQESDEIESSDYKLSPTGRKIRAKHIIFRSQDDDVNQDDQTKKEQKEKMKTEGVYRPGWMLKADPKLKAKIDAIKKINKARRAAYGNPAAGKSIPRDVTEQIDLDEASMTDAEMKKREEIVKSMKKKIQGFKDRYGDRAKSVMYATATKLAMKEELGLEESNEHYEEAEKHLSLANDADAKGNKGAFHAHMADHHDSMSQWHESKGRSASADKHAEKADYHQEQSLKHPYKESFDLDEAFKDDGKMDWDAWKQKAKKHGAVKFVDTDNKTIAYDKNSKQVSSITWSSKKKDKLSEQTLEFDLDESSQGHTIEAHGIRGMKGTPWRKTFKTVYHMNAWADKNDSVEIHGTRDLEKPSSIKEESDIQKGDRVVADLRKDKKYPGTNNYRSGIVTRVGEKGVHIKPDMGGEAEWHPHKIVKKLGTKSITEGVKMLEAKEPPFDGGVPSKGTVKDKSGAVHSPMSRARHLARQAMKKQVKESHDLIITDEQADDLIAESYLDNVQLDELSKSTLGSYVKKAKGSAIGAAQVTGMGSSMTGQKTQDKAETKLHKRASGINKAVDRLTKEEVEDLSEATYVVKHDGVADDHADAAAKKLFAGKTNVNSHVSKYAPSAEKHADMLKSKGFKNVRIQKMNNEEVEHLDEAWSDNEKLNKAHDVLKKHGYDYADSRNFGKKDEKHYYDGLHQDKKTSTLHRVTVHPDGSWTAHTNTKNERLNSRNINDVHSKKTGAGSDAQSLNKHITDWHNQKSHPIKTALKKIFNKEEYELDEAMISYSDFHAKMAAHRKAGNDIADSHYSDKKAHYTVVDKEGTARKVTHTEKGSKMENLGAHKGEVEDESGQKVQKTVHEPAVKRGRGRPAGKTGLSYKPRDPASKAASAAKAAASKAANRAKKLNNK